MRNIGVLKPHSHNQEELHDFFCSKLISLLNFPARQLCSVGRSTMVEDSLLNFPTRQLCSVGRSTMVEDSLFGGTESFRQAHTDQSF
jgi:hypothetical protein